MAGKAQFAAEVRLISARIGDSLHLRKRIFDGNFDLTSATIADEL